jgi:hypothetical protein
MDFVSSIVFSSAVNGVADGISAVVVIVIAAVLTSAMGTALNGMNSIDVILPFISIIFPTLSPFL